MTAKSGLPSHWGELIVQADRNQYDTFFGKVAGHQCVFNSAMFLRAVYLYGIERVVNNQVIEMFMKQASELMLLITDTVRYLQCNELPNTIKTGKITTISIRSISYGNMSISGDMPSFAVEGMQFNNGYDFHTNVLMKRSRDLDDYILLIIGAFSVAAYRTQETMYIFEPHGINGSGAVITKIPRSEFYNFLVNYGASNANFEVTFIYFTQISKNQYTDYRPQDVLAFFKANQGALDIEEEKFIKVVGTELDLGLVPTPKINIDSYMEKKRKSAIKRKLPSIREGPKRKSKPLVVSNTISSTDVMQQAARQATDKWQSIDKTQKLSDKYNQYKVQMTRLSRAVVTPFKLSLRDDEEDFQESIIKNISTKLLSFIIENGFVAKRQAESPLIDNIKFIANLESLKKHYPRSIEFLDSTSLNIENIRDNPDALQLFIDSGEDPGLFIKEKVGKVIQKLVKRTENLLDIINNSVPENQAPTETLNMFLTNVQTSITHQFNDLYIGKSPSGASILDVVSDITKELMEAINREDEQNQIILDLLEYVFSNSANALLNETPLALITTDSFPPSLQLDSAAIIYANQQYKELLSKIKERTTKALVLYNKMIEYSISTSKVNKTKFVINLAARVNIQEYYNTLKTIEKQFKILQQYFHNQVQFANLFKEPINQRFQNLMQLDEQIHTKEGLTDWINELTIVSLEDYISDQQINVEAIQKLQKEAEEITKGELVMNKIKEDMETTRAIIESESPEIAKISIQTMLIAITNNKSLAKLPEDKNTLVSFTNTLNKALREVDAKIISQKKEEEKYALFIRNFLKPTSDFKAARSAKDELSRYIKMGKNPSEDIISNEDIRKGVTNDFLKLLESFSKNLEKSKAKKIKGTGQVISQLINLIDFKTFIPQEAIFFERYADDLASQNETSFQSQDYTSYIALLYDIIKNLDSPLPENFEFLNTLISQAEQKVSEQLKLARHEEIKKVLNRLINTVSEIAIKLNVDPSDLLYAQALSELENVNNSILNLKLSDEEKEEFEKKLNTIINKEAQIKDGYKIWQEGVRNKMMMLQAETVMENIRRILTLSADNFIFNSKEYEYILSEYKTTLKDKTVEQNEIIRLTTEAVKSANSKLLSTIKTFLSYNPYYPAHSSEKIPKDLITNIDWVGNYKNVLTTIQDGLSISTSEAKNLTELFEILHTYLQTHSLIDYYELVNFAHNKINTIQSISPLLEFYMGAHESFVTQQSTISAVKNKILLARQDIYLTTYTGFEDYHLVTEPEEAKLAIIDLRKTKIIDPRVDEIMRKTSTLDNSVFVKSAYEENMKLQRESLTKEILSLEKDVENAIEWKRAEVINRLQSIVDEQIEAQNLIDEKFGELKRKVMVDAPVSIKKSILDAQKSEELVKLWIDTFEDVQIRNDLSLIQMKPFVRWLNVSREPITLSMLNKPIDDLAGPLDVYTNDFERFVKKIRDVETLAREINILVEQSSLAYDTLKSRYKNADKSESDYEGAKESLKQTNANLTTLKETIDNEFYYMIEDSKVKQLLEKETDIQSIETSLRNMEKEIDEVDLLIQGAIKMYAYQELLAISQRIDTVMQKDGNLPKWKATKLMPYKQLVNLRLGLYNAYANTKTVNVNQTSAEFTGPVNYASEAIMFEALDKRLARYGSLNDNSLMNVGQYTSSIDKSGPIFITNDSKVINYSMCYQTIMEKFVDVMTKDFNKLSKQTTGDSTLKLNVPATEAEFISAMVKSLGLNYSEITNASTVNEYTMYVNNKKWPMVRGNYTATSMALYTYVIYSTIKNKYGEKPLLISPDAGILSKSSGTRFKLSLKELLQILISIYPEHIITFVQQPHVQQLEYIRKTIFDLAPEALKLMTVNSLLKGQRKLKAPPVTDRNSIFGIIEKEWVSLTIPADLKGLFKLLSKIGPEDTINNLKNLTIDGDKFAELLYVLALYVIPDKILSLQWDAFRPLNQKSQTIKDYILQKLSFKVKYIRSTTVSSQQIDPKLSSLYDYSGKLITYTSISQKSSDVVSAFDFVILSLTFGIPMVIVNKFETFSGISVFKILDDLRYENSNYASIVNNLTYDLGFLKSIVRDNQVIENACLLGQISNHISILSKKSFRDMTPLLVSVDEFNDVTEIWNEGTNKIESLYFEIKPETIEDVRLPSVTQQEFLPTSGSDILFSAELGINVDFTKLQITDVLNFEPVFDNAILDSDSDVSSQLDDDTYLEFDEDWTMSQPSTPLPQIVDEPKAPVKRSEPIPAPPTVIRTEPKPSIVVTSVTPDKPLPREETYTIVEDSFKKVKSGHQLLELNSLLKSSFEAILIGIEDLRRYLHLKTNNLVMEIQRIKLILD